MLVSRRPLFLLSSVAGPSDYIFYAYLKMADCHGSINPNRPGEGSGGGGGGRVRGQKVPALISGLRAIPTKFCHFY